MEYNNRLNLSLSLSNEGHSGSFNGKNVIRPYARAEEGCSGRKRKFTFDEIENNLKRHLTEAHVDNSPHTVKFVAPSAVLMDLPAEQEQQSFRKELEKEREAFRKELEHERETFWRKFEEQEGLRKELENERETFRKEFEKQEGLRKKLEHERETFRKELEEREGEGFRKELEKKLESVRKELEETLVRMVEVEDENSELELAAREAAWKEQNLVKEMVTIRADSEDCKKKMLAASTDIEWLVRKGISATIRRFLKSREFIETQCMINRACFDLGVDTICKLMRDMHVPSLPDSSLPFYKPKALEKVFTAFEDLVDTDYELLTGFGDGRITLEDLRWLSNLEPASV